MTGLREGDNNISLSIKKRYRKQKDFNGDDPNCRPAIANPNRAVPGNWWGSFSYSRTAAPNQGAQSMSYSREDNSIDEFFETHEHLSSVPAHAYDTASSPRIVIDALTSATLDDFNPCVEPHMTAPLLPDDSPLDFSCLYSQRGETSVNTASPLARVWEFNTNIDIDECSLLNIFADEFENLSCVEDPHRPSLWSKLKKYTRGMSDDDYDSENPWAKYSPRHKLPQEP